MEKELKAEVTIYLQGREDESDKELLKRFDDVLEDSLCYLVDHRFEYTVKKKEIIKEY